jgi:RNA polymerase primary sigma factor
MSSAKPPPELALVAEALAGKPGAAARLLEIASQAAWSVVIQLEDSAAAREAAFRQVMTSLADDGFGRLKPFDGRARLTTFIALIARDVMAEQLARSFVEAPRQAWARFERFFGADIRRRIARRFHAKPEARFTTTPIRKSGSSWSRTTFAVSGRMAAAAASPATC